MDNKKFSTREQSEAMRKAGEKLFKDIDENVLPYLNNQILSGDGKFELNVIEKI